MSAIDPSLARRHPIELAAELIARGLASYDEFLPHFLAAAGDPPIGSAKRCRIAWRLADETARWVRNYDHATARALRATRIAIEAGATEVEPIFQAAIAAADSVLPGCHDRHSLAPLLHEQWLRIRARPLSPIGRSRR